MIKNKGDNEIISQALIILIVTITVGLIITVLIPFIGEMQSKIRYENSIKQLDLFDQKIAEILNEPIGTTKNISLNLSQLYLNIDNNKVEIYSITNNNSSFFKDGLRIDEGNKYRYREGQRIVIGVIYSDLIFSNSINLENKNNITLILKKTHKDRLSVAQEYVTRTEWYNPSSNIYSQNQGEFEYRKLLLINSSKVDGDLENFPVLIDLEDEDLKNYAKADGSDIMFTDENGTKLKREIENYNQSKYYYKKIIIDHEKVEETTNNFILLLSITDSDLIEHSREDGKDIYFTASNNSKIDHEIEYFNKSEGKLVAWIIIPETSSTIDTEIRMYFGETIFDNLNNIWDENYVFVHHLNESPSNDQTNGFLDSSIYSNHGTAVGFSNNQYSNTDSNGIIDGAIILDVNNNYIYFNNAEHVDLKKTDKFTISGWIKRDSSNSGSYENTLTHNGWGPWSVVSDDGNISFIFDDDIKRCETEIVSDQYVNFVFVNDVDNSYGYGDNKLLLYLNGEIANNCPTIDE